MPSSQVVDEGIRMKTGQPQEGRPTIVVIFDGGSQGNPGPAYGSYRLEIPDRPPVVQRIDFGEELTNNQAEYRTLLAALHVLLAELEQNGASPASFAVSIMTDSELVAHQLSGKYKVRHPNLQPLYREAMSLLDRFAEWSITWRPREVIYSYFGH